jgi:hypothetical protein
MGPYSQGAVTNQRLGMLPLRVAEKIQGVWEA